jgi:hypothetical protein
MMLRRLTVHPHLRLRFNSIDHYAFHHSVFRAESTLEKPTLRISPPPPPRVGENLFDNDGRNDQDIESMATNIVQHALRHCRWSLCKPGEETASTEPGGWGVSRPLPPIRHRGRDGGYQAALQKHVSEEHRGHC